MNLQTLEGKGRLAERAKPLLAQIPDGAFGDLMKQRLTELTGVGARAPQPEAQALAPRTRPHGAQHGSKPSLVRSAITMLMQQPQVALALPSSLHFASLDQPGIGLLVEIIELVHQRPDISTGLILEHFGDRSEAPALTKLATAGAVETTASTPLDARVLDDADRRQQAFLDAIARLDAQALQARIESLQARMATLVDAEKQELRELLSLRMLSRH